MMDPMSQIPVVCYCSIVRCWIVLNGLCVMDIGVNECSYNDTCPGDQQCLDLPTHHTCVCPHGFQITETGCEGWSTHYMLFLCPLTKNSLVFLVDVNECQQYGHCSQYCTNTEGSFSCSCSDGYTLESDKMTCRANGKSPCL